MQKSGKFPGFPVDSCIVWVGNLAGLLHSLLDHAQTVAHSGINKSIPFYEGQTPMLQSVKPNLSRIWYNPLYTFGTTPNPVTVTIITFLVGNPYNPSFATVTG